MDASNAIKHWRIWLKQNLPREVSRGYITKVVANAMGSFLSMLDMESVKKALSSKEKSTKEIRNFYT